MCGICGCDTGKVEGKHVKNDESILQHTHHEDNHNTLLHIEQNLFAKNNQFADQNRHYFRKNNILTFNIVSSPGSGKTTLLVNTIEALKDKITLSVIEGDQHTEIDADRIRATQVPVVQVNTGKMCHLDAHQVGHAVTELSPKQNSILFIENVGNLICPALFDLGEACNIVILSVTEGDDKPLKYPDIFHRADVMVINKIDLLPHVAFDVAKSIDYARRINPKIEVIKTSATTEAGLAEWCAWIAKYKSKYFHATISA